MYRKVTQYSRPCQAGSLEWAKADDDALSGSADSCYLAPPGKIYCLYHFLIVAMHSRTLLLTALLTATMFVESANAQSQRVRLVTPSHLPQATDVATIYVANCKDGQYQLTVSPAKKMVILSRRNEPDTDLSMTTVGSRLLEQDVLVQVGFNCPQDAINIFLKGVKLVDLGMPTGFRAGISVRSNGEVVTSHYPADARIDELATPPAGVSVIKP